MHVVYQITWTFYDFELFVCLYDSCPSNTEVTVITGGLLERGSAAEPTLKSVRLQYSVPRYKIKRSSLVYAEKKGRGGGEVLTAWTTDSS